MSITSHKTSLKVHHIDRVRIQVHHITSQVHKGTTSPSHLKSSRVLKITHGQVEGGWPRLARGRWRVLVRRRVVQCVPRLILQIGTHNLSKNNKDIIIPTNKAYSRECQKVLQESKAELVRRREEAASHSSSTRQVLVSR